MYQNRASTGTMLLSAASSRYCPDTGTLWHVYCINSCSSRHDLNSLIVDTLRKPIRHDVIINNTLTWSSGSSASPSSWASSLTIASAIAVLILGPLRPCLWVVSCGKSGSTSSLSSSLIADGEYGLAVLWPANGPLSTGRALMRRGAWADLLTHQYPIQCRFSLDDASQWLTSCYCCNKYLGDHLAAMYLPP